MTFVSVSTDVGLHTQPCLSVVFETQQLLLRPYRLRLYETRTITADADTIPRGVRPTLLAGGNWRCRLPLAECIDLLHVAAHGLERVAAGTHAALTRVQRAPLAACAVQRSVAGGMGLQPAHQDLWRPHHGIAQEVMAQGTAQADASAT